MAKADTVYSLFGMETPQQVAARRLKEQTALLSQYQRDPFQSAGAAIGLGLAKLFGPEDQQMARAIQGQEIVTGARSEARQAEEAKAADLAKFQAQLRSAGGRTTPEGRPLINLSAEEKLAKDQEKYYELYNQIADRLDAAGFAMEAENARTKASQQLLGSLSIRKQLADIGYTEAKTASEGRGKWTSVGNYMVPGSDTPVLGGLYNGQLAVYGQGGQPQPMPEGAQKQVTTGTVPATTVPTVAQAGIAMPWIKQDPIASELSKDEQGALAGWMASKAQELLDQKKTADPNAAYQLALQEAKKLGLLTSEAPMDVLGVDIPFTGGASFTLPGQATEQSLGDTPARDVAMPVTPPSQSTDPEGTVRRRVGDRVGLFDEKSKQFIRYID